MQRIIRLKDCELRTMNVTAILSATIFRISNLLDELPKKIGVLLERNCDIEETYKGESIGDNDDSLETNTIVDGLRAFKEFACLRINMTPKEKRARFSKQYNVQIEAKSAVLQIRNERKSLARTRLEFENYVTTTSAEVASDRKSAETAIEILMNVASEISAEPVGHEKESKMEFLWVAMTLLEETIGQTKRMNASRQNDFKALRLEAEKRCLAAVKKYDCQVGVRHRLLEELSGEKDGLREKQEYTENRAAVQSILYAQLKEEREIGLMAAFTRKLNNFCRNRAAKVVQRAWRRYYERARGKRRRKTKKR